MKFFEPIFHVLYLVCIFFMAIKMILKGNINNNRLIKLFGYMAFILGFGDLFHLIPRIYALLTTGLEENAAILGMGKFITSITMTLFYVILFRIWEIRFKVKKDTWMRVLVSVLVIARIVISFLPENQWALYNAPVDWAIYRNIPFVILGGLIAYLILDKAIKNKDLMFKSIGVAVIVSFACYLPVILFASRFKLIGMLMIPKTLAYLWVIYLGYKKLR